ncbi:MAG: SufS family cysteine desulfurase [Candidatus Peribacteraceae bacterium]|nr:SufS family cysteine desulfurase [Candidatus Peribacteraceae bacterium]
MDLSAVRRQFPLIARGKSVYLDSAATAQKPETVLKAMDAYYREENANVHRGMYDLAEQATESFEQSRSAVQHFIHARHADEIIFTKNATESLNLVVRSWGRANLVQGDAVVLTILDHHSATVPWMQLREETGVEIRWLDCDETGMIRVNDLQRMLAQGKVKFVSLTGVSNVLGVRPPIGELTAIAHAAGAVVCIDAAQMAPHHPMDVEALDCDFLALSGHKLYGPTGIGVLYGKRELLKTMPPFLGGGSMIAEVHRDGFTPADAPQKFEAGTPPIAEAIGLAAAIDWLGQYPWKDIQAHEAVLMRAAFQTLQSIPGLKILGPQNPEDVSACVSFTVEGIHPHDLTDVLGHEGICLRAGHHCAQPLHERFGIPASARLSVGIYNTEEEIRSVGPAIARAIALLKK